MTGKERQGMKREEKYKDTRTFHFYNANPKGKYTGDCVIRAISTATGKPWADVLRDLTEYGIKYGQMPNDPKLYDKYLTANGWVKMKQPRYSTGAKMTGDDFCLYHAEEGKTYIAHIGGHHIVCIKDCRVWDTWDCAEKCIGNYWVKRNG